MEVIFSSKANDRLITFEDSYVLYFSDEELRSCRFRSHESDSISKEEDIDDYILSSDAPADICGHLSILTKKISVT
ncbi:hypothetical protein NPIL_401421 [Nephila pilipes]|uniref:Uncharacterized protein n=1 Tax=Nephila pilipes TaxID=299642 RepID=A0A8X6NMQ2_NEPPI|nr:hypothetical protein NPIL_401421 [Nephila pilipes]